MTLIEVWKQLWRAANIAVTLNPFALPLLVVSFIYLFKVIRGRRVKLPPSPPRLPIIGNLHHLRRALHQSFQILSKKYGPIMLLHFGSIPTIVISSGELAREVLRTRETSFLNRTRNKASTILFRGKEDIVFGKYSDHWRQSRKIAVNELLSLRAVQSFRHVKEEEISELMEKIRLSAREGLSVDIGKIMVLISNNIITRSVVGKRYDAVNSNEHTFGEIIRQTVDFIASFWFEDYIPYLGWIDTLTGLNARTRKTADEFHAFLDRIIDEHEIQNAEKQKNEKKDFVDILLHLQNSGLLDIELTRDSIKSILLDMLVAGTDTTAALMEWAFAEIVKHPNVMKKIQDEVRRVLGGKSRIDEADMKQMSFLRCALKEALRLHSCFFHVRTSTENVTLAGYEIPSKTRIFIHSWIIQKDPNTWDRAEEYIPERFVNEPLDFKGQDFRFFPFGSGRRNCPGITYAVMETEYLIANLLYWFDWKFPDGVTAENLDMEEASLQLNRRNIPLSLVPVIRHP